jgi:predicted NBD/HSP70 family sugar kinase
MKAPPSWHIGIDVGGTWTRLLAGRADGTRLEVAPVPTPSTYAELIGTIVDMVPSEAVGQIAAVGCGIPGATDGERPLFVPALPWTEGELLRSHLCSVLQTTVRLGTDGHFTLLAEAREGAAAGVASAVLVAVGTGIGGAVMIGGRIWRGHHASAGSWGWLPATGAGVVPGHGSFEQMASGTALSALANSLVPGWSGPDLVQAARLGDVTALSALSGYAGQLAAGIAGIASILDPEVVLIGGGVSAAMDVLGPLLHEQIRALASPDGGRVTVRAAALGPQAGVVGALLAAQGGEEVWH